MGVKEECLHRLYQIIKFLFVKIKTDTDPLDFQNQFLQGLVEGWLLSKPGRIADINNITDAEQAEAETETSDAVKAALLALVA